MIFMLHLSKMKLIIKKYNFTNLTSIKYRYVCSLIFCPSSVQNNLTCHNPSSASIDIFFSSYSLRHSICASCGQTPCGLDAVCFAPSLKAQWICRVTAIVLPYWSLTGHIEAQQDFKGTKAVYCIVLSSKWRSLSSYGEGSLVISAERGSMGEQVKG